MAGRDAGDAAARGVDEPLDAVVGLGANLGDRAWALRSAVARLRASARVAAAPLVSRVYETAPVGPPQPAYLNAAARLRYRGSPRALLDELLAIERDHGRVRDERWGPRTLDLDILWIDGVVVDEPGLTVPHPRLHERAFALLPLLDVAPGARSPLTGAAYAAPTDADGVETTALRLDD